MVGDSPNRHTPLPLRMERTLPQKLVRGQEGVIVYALSVVLVCV